MQLNEKYIELKNGEFNDYCTSLYNSGNFIIRLMFASDEREIDNCFKIYAVFSQKDKDMFYIPFFKLKEDNLNYKSLTPDIPAVHWYEREIYDMFGLVPEGHPDPRRLVFHDSFPPNSFPLRKDWSISESDLKEWGEGAVKKVPYNFLEVDGEGVYEIPVGPVHAGIIEPGHFRFSAVGETIFFLEPRLFYTHKGIEKHFETFGFAYGVKLAERVSGISSFSHSSAYCMAVEKLAGIEISDAAKAVRTFFLELERLYNHIGDIGNMCAGAGFAVGYAKGAVIKEKLMQLNYELSKSRFLRGINLLGGVNVDIFAKKDYIIKTVNEILKEYREFLQFLLNSVYYLDRLENTGILSKDTALQLGVTGVAARASGIDDDIRKNHPHLLYDRLIFDSHLKEKGDLFSRMMVRAYEVESSVSIINAIFETNYEGELVREVKSIPPCSSALGYTETSIGSLFYWVMSNKEGMPLRVKLRSPSYCNWPAVSFAVYKSVVPDFPLCNKSFNLSYSGCDM